MARTKAFDETEVLDKALNIFWRKGYYGTSMQDLVDGLGISRSSLYDTYADKRDLFLAALKKYREERAAFMTELVNQSPSVIKALQTLFKGLIDSSLADPSNKGCFMTNTAVEIAPHDPEIAQIVAGNMQDIEDVFYKAIRKGQQTGEITTKHSARTLARFLFNAISGLRVTGKSCADKKLYEDVVAVALSVLKDVTH